MFYIIITGEKASKVDIEIVPCTLLSMEFFDRLIENGVIYENGKLRKCFDEYYENFAISDELRKVNVALSLINLFL